MKMFDWDDQELANILWGEDTEADDHIVPYPEDIGENDLAHLGDSDQKTLNQEATYINGAEKTQTISNLLSQDKNDGVHISASGTAKDPQLDSPPFSTSKIDYAVIAEETELGIDPEVSGNQHEDKKLGELVGNNWANIGSFDDLDRMFSNDKLDGHSSLGGPDELWPSSKDLTRGAFKSLSGDLGSKKWEFGELENTSSKTELNSEYMHEWTSAAMRFVKTDSSKSGRFVEQECTMGTSALIEEKDDLSTNPPKYQQINKKITDSTPSGDVYDTCPSYTAVYSHYDRLRSPITVPNFPSAVHSDFCNTYVDPFEHKSLPRQHSANRMVKPINDERPMNMTPQEKIEKLRRRQQMRAMLAIHKQQQQLSHQASRVDYPLSQKIYQEDSFLRMEKAELEVNENLSPYSCNPGSSDTKANVSTICDMDEYSSADMVLYQLQDIIARLDMRVRLCIKDSLFRLAHSATQRHYASDANAAKSSSSTSHAEITEEDLSSHDRIAGNATAETETNHIDRAVAHLLFHRPFKALVKPAETPESSHSNKVCIEKSDSKANSSDKNLDLRRPFVDSCQEELAHSEMQLDRTKQNM
ncbi:protein LNK2 [Silene latifolia]|uniref:protein LNK2 n=1 Tax=Silene latifolia TaxID=37657 RepID=UPI003D76D64A